MKSRYYTDKFLAGFKPATSSFAKVVLYSLSYRGTV